MILCPRFISGLNGRSKRRETRGGYTQTMTPSPKALRLKKNLDKALQELALIRKGAPADFQEWVRWQHKTEYPAAQKVTELYQALGMQLYYDMGWPEGAEDQMSLGRKRSTPAAGKKAQRGREKPATGGSRQ